MPLPKRRLLRFLRRKKRTTCPSTWAWMYRPPRWKQWKPRQCLTRPWGLEFDSPWEVGRLPLGRDWSILCYTDGITEGGHPGDALDARRTAAYHRAHADLRRD